MALQVPLIIPPDMILAVPVIPDGATSEEAAAIQAQIDAANLHNIGIGYPASYARILYVRTMPQQTYIFVNWYADEAARQADEQPVKVYEYCAPTAALVGDIYPAAYAWLKAQPEFLGAIDV